ncbi:hypothetical protein VQ056_04695 [Paenibacillus sp. JTLBN-2024]
MHRPIMKAASVLLAAAISASMIAAAQGPLSRDVSASAAQTPERLDLSGIKPSVKAGGYEAYLSKHQHEAPSAEDVVIEADAFSKAEGMQVSVLQDYEGEPGKSIRTADAGTVTWQFDVKQAGLYNIRLKMFTEPGKDSDIERELAIDGAVPFSEAKSLVFNRVWKNEKQEFDRDASGKMPLWLGGSTPKKTRGFCASNLPLPFKKQGKVTLWKSRWNGWISRRSRQGPRKSKRFCFGPRHKCLQPLQGRPASSAAVFCFGSGRRIRLAESRLPRRKRLLRCPISPVYREPGRGTVSVDGFRRWRLV